MSIAHLEKLRKELEDHHWVIEHEQGELTDTAKRTWTIARPDGVSRLLLEFSGGSGPYGETFEGDKVDVAFACDAPSLPQLEGLFFGSKFHGKFQNDVVRFVADLCRLEKSGKIQS